MGVYDRPVWNWIKMLSILTSTLSTSMGMTLASFRDHFAYENYFSELKKDNKNFFYSKFIMTLFIAIDYFCRATLIAVLGRNLSAHGLDFPFEAILMWLGFTIFELMIESVLSNHCGFGGLCVCKNFKEVVVDVMVGFTCSRWFLQKYNWIMISYFAMIRYASMGIVLYVVVSQFRKSAWAAVACYIASMVNLILLWLLHREILGGQLLSEKKRLEAAAYAEATGEDLKAAQVRMGWHA